MAWVQGPAFHRSSAGTNALAFAGSTPAGNLMVACITQLFGANPPRDITSVADSVDGANFTLAVSRTHAGTDARADIYYRVAASGGTRTVTVTYTGGSADSNLALNEYDSTYTVLDAINSNEGTGTSATPGSVSPSGNATYVSVLIDANGVVITPPGGIWTQEQEDESSSVAPISVIDAITSGAQNPTTTLGASPGNWVNLIATFVTGTPPTPYLSKSIPNQFSRTYRPGPFKPGVSR